MRSVPRSSGARKPRDCPTAPRDCPQGLPRKTAQVATRLHEALQSNSMACYCAEGWNSGCGGCGGFRPGPKKQILPSPSKSIELDIKTLQARLNTYDLYDNNYNIFSKSRKTGELQVKRIASEGLGSLGCMKFEHEHLGHLGENVACTSLMIFDDLCLLRVNGCQWSNEIQ